MSNQTKPEKKRLFSGNDEKKALTVRMSSELYDKVEEVAHELGQKAAAIARNYLQFSKLIFVKSNMEMTTRDNNPLSLFPIPVLDLIMSSLRKVDEDIQKEIGDKLASIINVNTILLKCDTLQEKMELIKTLGWFSYLPEKFLRIPRKFAPPMLVTALVYRLVKNKKIPNEWSIATLYSEDLNSNKYEKKELKAEKSRMEILRLNFEQTLGNTNGIFDERTMYDYYEFDKIHLEEEEQ